MAIGKRFGRRRHRPPPGTDEGVFDPRDADKVKHTKLGVWDLYEEIEPKLKMVPGSLRSRMESYHEMKGSFPYVVRMFNDIASIPGCGWLFGSYLVVCLLLSLIPAIELWYSGLLLKIVQNAVEQRTVDQNDLFRVVISRLICSAVTRVLHYISGLFYTPLNERLRQHFTVHNFHALARLDVPTYADAGVQQRLRANSDHTRYSVVWNHVVTSLHLFTTGVQLASQLSVLIGLLRDQRDGPLLAVLSFGHTLFQTKTRVRSWGPTGVWAATTTDPDYLRYEGLSRMVGDQAHRKEMVAGGIAEYMVSSYRASVKRLGNRATGFYEAFQMENFINKLHLMPFLSDPLGELPQIVFTLRAVQYPANIPLSLASLNLITQTTSKFSRTLLDLFDQTESVAEKLASIRKVYEAESIPNMVVDGDTPFPEQSASVRFGVSIEFRNVSFHYPGSEKDVIRNVSFKIQEGQLCVIVGANGSGKSTILKLITRLYDPTEGQILMNDRDIRTLKLADLRRATSVLFQDYTHFPLSIRDNIGLGDPNNLHDDDKIHEAARLGGALEFVERLDDGFDTYLDRPVDDVYSSLPQGTTTLFGRPVEYEGIRGVGGMSTHAMGLSGGQMQRIALSRTFMRDEGVGLLCFDEPSASLDPTAEHDLFERLRELRKNKTMIFSSHRFGNLTRHADLILYMDDAVVLEEGTHEELLKKGGGYAKIWMLQAQAFLP